MYPLLFPLEDEREKRLRIKLVEQHLYRYGLSYLVQLDFNFSPIINEYLPGYPLYILFSIFFIQMTVFHVSLYRNKLA